MMKDTLDNKIRAYIKSQRVYKLLGLGENFIVRFLAQGEYNINFILEGLDKKYVFRLNTKSQLNLKNQIKYEYEALKSLEISGVTPKVYFLDDSNNYFEYGILIMEFLNGTPLSYESDLKTAAKIFSKIHSIDVNAINYNGFIEENNIFTERIKESNRLLNGFLKSPKVGIELKNFFETFLKWAEVNENNQKYFIENKWHVINNTEVNSENFIIGCEKSYLIDWEKPVISDPCQDLTQFLAPTTTLWKTDYILKASEKENFIKAYINGLEAGDKNIRARIELYTPYLYLRALSWCAYAYLEYQREDKEIKNMDTYKKINQYLDINFMKALMKPYFNF